MRRTVEPVMGGGGAVASAFPVEVFRFGIENSALKFESKCPVCVCM